MTSTSLVYPATSVRVEAFNPWAPLSREVSYGCDIIVNTRALCIVDVQGFLMHMLALEDVWSIGFYENLDGRRFSLVREMHRFRRPRKY